MRIVVWIAILFFCSIKIYANDNYKKVCSACHQLNAEGVEGVFPPLKGWVNQLAKTQKGRNYLIMVVSFGLNDEIEVNQVSYNGYMPPNPQLSDEEIAELMNFITIQLNNDTNIQEFKPSEVKKIRKPGVTMKQVAEYRKIAIQSIQ